MRPAATPELYVGYQKTAPPGIARFVRGLAAVLLVLAAALGGALTALQAPFGPGVFEFGRPREVVGTVRETPYPLLLVFRPGRTTAARGISPWLLVAFGKHGAGAAVAGLEGASVQLSGSLIYRDGLTMLEVVEDSVRTRRDLEPAPASPWEDLGPVSLVGEVVDGKCHLGVMKPGRGVAHRACAIRCLSGGIPPLLAVQTAAGQGALYLLLDEARGPLGRTPIGLAGVPVAARGRVWRRDGLLYLAVTATGLRPLGSREGRS